MKKIFMALLLAAALCGTAASSYAADAVVQPDSEKAYNPIEQFTGKYWLDSTEENKEAYLFGIESAIAVDYFIAQAESQKKGKTRRSGALSKFDTAWMDAFKDVTRQQIVTEVDNWYKANPEQINRPVLAVIWYELIEPRLNQAK